MSIENVPMRLAMKLGVSLARTTPLPRRRSQKSAERVEHFRRSGGAGNELDELHVTRRIEEMRAGPMALEIVGEAFGDLADGKAGGVGGDDGAGAAMRRNSLQQAALDGEIFGDGFDDPVGLGAPGEVVLEIADGDAARPWRE